MNVQTRHDRVGRDPRSRWVDTVEVERELPGRDLRPRRRNQRGELDLVMRGAEVLHDRTDTTLLRRNLHRRRPGTGTHATHVEPHEPSLEAAD